MIKTNPINNKDSQSNKEVITIDLQLNIRKFQSIKINQIIYDKIYAPKNNRTNPKETKINKSNKTNRHKHKSKIKTISSAPQTNIFHLNCLDLNQ